MATQNISYGTTTAMGATALALLANSATVGWQSDRISNLGNKSIDYEIAVYFHMTATAPANDKAVYIWLAPWFTTDAGTTWLAPSIGTTTAMGGTASACTIASPNNLRLLGILNYTTTAMQLRDTFLLSNAFGSSVPDAWGLVVTNYSGAAIGSTVSLYYTPITYTIA